MAEGVVVWVTGPNEPAVARVADAVVERLARRRLPVELLTKRSPGIDVLEGPGMEGRVAFVAGTLVHHGVAVVAAVPSPSRTAREAARAAVGRLIEVYVAVGGGGAYEPPARAEVQVDFPETELEAAIDRTLRTLEVLGYLRPADDPAYSAEEERQVIRRLKGFGYI